MRMTLSLQGSDPVEERKNEAVPGRVVRKAGRQCPQRPWAALPVLGADAAQHLWSQGLPQEHRTPRGTWPLAHHSPPRWKEALFIRAAFLGTNTSEARSGLEVERQCLKYCLHLDLEVWFNIYVCARVLESKAERMTKSYRIKPPPPSPPSCVQA